MLEASAVSLGQIFVCLSCSFVHHWEASFVKELNCWLITTKLRVQNILIPANTTGEIPVSSNSTRSKLHLHYFVTCKQILWEKKEGEQSRLEVLGSMLFSLFFYLPPPPPPEKSPTNIEIVRRYFIRISYEGWATY